MKYDEALMFVIHICPGSVLCDPTLSLFQLHPYGLEPFFRPALFHPFPGEIQCCLAILALPLDIDADLLQQALHRFQMAILGCTTQRHSSLLVLRFDVGFGLLGQPRQGLQMAIPRYIMHGNPHLIISLIDNTSQQTE